MTERIRLVQGDTRPSLILALTDTLTGDPINIQNSVVKMYFRARGTTTVLSTLTGILLTGLELEDGTISTTPPYDVTGVGGRVQFNWPVNSLNVEPGNYEGEIEITFADNTIQTVYDTLKFRLRADF
jgi:hypothetical protein